MIEYQQWQKDGEFAPVENKYARYARISDKGTTILVRGSIRDEYPNSGWPIKMAREYATYIFELTDKMERENVKELVADLEKADETSGEFDGTWEGIAVQLKRMGYHK